MRRRVVEPEILDQLPPDDPRAVRSRGDLSRINWFMGNVELLARTLGRLKASPRTIVDLGSGDGTVALALAQQLKWRDVEIRLLDMRPVVSPGTLRGFRDLGWKAKVLAVNLHEWIQDSPRCDLLLANLFLHHFEDEQLRSLFRDFSRIAEAVVSCDPRRWRPAMLTTRMLWLIGCNAVTRHDARVSVNAGFRDRELSALWPENCGFAIEEFAGGFASHLFVATKRQIETNPDAG